MLHKLVAAATLGRVVLILGATVLPDAVFGLLFFVFWIGMPVEIYLGSRRLSAGWPKRTWAYILGALLWFVAVVPGAIFLWRRRSVCA